jgi:hypothetical protein
MSDYSTFYDSSFDVSGLPDLPSLVRIDRAAIGITETKCIKIGNLTTQVFGTGEVSWFSFNLYNVEWFQPLLWMQQYFWQAWTDHLCGLNHLVTETQVCFPINYHAFQFIIVLVDIYGMGSWLTNHGALCYHNNKLAAYVECIIHGRKRRGKGLFNYYVVTLGNNDRFSSELIKTYLPQPPKQLKQLLLVWYYNQ